MYELIRTHVSFVSIVFISLEGIFFDWLSQKIFTPTYVVFLISRLEIIQKKLFLGNKYYITDMNLVTLALSSVLTYRNRRRGQW